MSHKNRNIFQELSRITPGGVNSPFRSFHEVSGQTLMLSHGKGSKIWDLDGNRYLDYLGAWGPAILGHAHPEVVKAAKAAVDSSAVLGLSSAWELEMAKLVQGAFPSMEMIRFVNSGAEAVESAIRLARGATRRSKIVRFEGGYHGHGDSVLWTYGPEENHSPEESGVPRGLAGETLIIPFNDPAALKKTFQKHQGQIAALLVEPVAGSMSVVPPKIDFLNLCRELTFNYGTVLIFDEVLTGFRIAFGGAQEKFGVKADLTCLGKILGGGFPAGGYGGRRDLMQHLAPLGPVYQAGTFSGNPVTMRAGIATLKELKKPGVYARLEEKTRHLLSGFQSIAKKQDIAIQIPHVGSLFAIAFSKNPIANYQDSLGIDIEAYSRFFHGMRKRGFLFAPSPTDASVVSLAHTEKEIIATHRAFAALLDEI